jgi:hypothetical protein
VLRDIRDLTSDPEAYAAELQRRWGGLLSYRYIGRQHASMNIGPADDTVTVRHDMRNGAGGLLLCVFGIASPEGGLVTDMEAVPNPVVHSCQVLDPGRDVKRFEVLTEDLSGAGRCPTAVHESSTQTGPTACWRSLRARGSALVPLRPGSSGWRLNR